MVNGTRSEPRASIGQAVTPAVVAAAVSAAVGFLFQYLDSARADAELTLKRMLINRESHPAVRIL
jgi:hypothetical protein